MKRPTSRDFLAQSRSWIRGLVTHTVERWRAWWEVSRRPEGVPIRAWLPFLRCRLVCLVRGHVEPAMLHRQEPRGRRTRLEVRVVCGRCGEERERKAQTAQFPRARA